MSTENVLFSKEYVTPTNAILKHAVVRLITAGTADEVDNVTDGTEWQFGVAREAAAIGARLEVQLHGIALCTASAAIVKGALVRATTAGKIVTSAPSAGDNDYVLGIALETAAADNDIIRVLLQQHLSTNPGGVEDGTIDCPLAGFSEEDGTALTIFSDGASATPGIAQEAAKEQCIRWNDNATLDKIGIAVALPQGADPAVNMNVSIMANVTGATDTPEIELEAYFGGGDTAGRYSGRSVEPDSAYRPEGRRARDRRHAGVLSGNHVHPKVGN